MAGFALDRGLSDVLRTRSDVELRSSNTFAGHMTDSANLAELRYWIDRLDLRSPAAVRDMLAWVRLLGQTNKDRHDYEAKVTLLARLAATFDASQKHELLRSILIWGGSDRKARTCKRCEL